MEIWVDENIPQGKEAFGAHGNVVTFPGRSLANKDLRGADALIVRSVTRVNAELLEGTHVRFVGTATIGTDHVDQAYLGARGIGFTSAPGCNARSVGEYVAAALSHLETRKGFALPGRTMGIIGHGHVGKQVERMALALGLSVLKCDPPMEAASSMRQAYVDLGTLLAKSDVISLHVPLVRGGPHPTLHLVDAGFFARLKHPVALLNTCRGEVIRESDLLVARAQGLIRHLVLDVFSGEPRIDPALCAQADLITPHIAGYSLPGKLNGTRDVAVAFRNFFGLADGWAPALPSPERPEIIHSPDFSARPDSDFRQTCIERAYDIAADDKRLRQALASAEPAAAFDRLRREYPVRHEFPAFRVTALPRDKAQLGKSLNNLGFQVG